MLARGLNASWPFFWEVIMAISAAAVKELREKTGAGMMDCQRALAEAGGDQDEAVKILRKKGLAAAAKKAGRAAKDGLVAVAVSPDGSRAGMVELNCETDFVARTEQYQAFAEQLAAQALAEGWGDLAQTLQRPLAGEVGHTVEQAIAARIATIGENIRLSRVVHLAAGEGMKVGSYVHMGGKIGVLVEVSAGASDETVKDVAMHIAAAEPGYVSRESVPESVLEDERDVARGQAAASGKPAQVVEKIVEGKVAKFLEQVCLLDQAFVKNPDQRVREMLAERGGAEVRAFVRFRLGEGGVPEGE